MITLTEATKLVPGRPNSSTLWRWCRKGVLARSGRRVFLRHSRLGGRIYVTQDWIDAFGQELAVEDAQHFSQREAEAPGGRQRHITARSRVDLAAELEAEGL